MATTVISGATEAIVNLGSVKKHNGGIDSNGNFFCAVRVNSANPNLQILGTDDKFSTFEQHNLANQHLSGSTTDSDVEPDTNYFTCFVDEEDFIHVLWKQTNNEGDFVAGTIYHIYGKINALDDITWYDAQPVRSSTLGLSLGDMVAFKAPDDPDYMMVLMVVSREGASQTWTHFHHHKFEIADPSNFTSLASTELVNFGGATQINRPVIEFRQSTDNGDGKTPHASAPHLYVAMTSADINAYWFFGSYSFSGGDAQWTWTNNQFRTSRYAASVLDGFALWHQILWADGSPWWICCGRDAGGTKYMMLNRMQVSSALQAGSDINYTTNIYGDGIAAYDITADEIKIFGIRDTSSFDFDRLDYDIGSDSFDPVSVSFETSLDNARPYLTANRHSERGYIMLVYARHTSGGYQIRAQPDAITFNHTPETPTGLQVNSGVADTTPEFECDVDDFDTGEQIKARFTIYESDGTTVVDTTDSSFRSGPGAVIKEYGSVLSPGMYKVSAKAIDDSGATSSESTKVDFSIQGTYSIDTDILCNVYEFDSLDIDLELNVESSSQLDVDLIINVAIGDQLDVDLILDIDTGWVPVDETPSDSIWTLVNDAPY